MALIGAVWYRVQICGVSQGVVCRWSQRPLHSQMHLDKIEEIWIFLYTFIRSNIFGAIGIMRQA